MDTRWSRVVSAVVCAGLLAVASAVSAQEAAEERTRGSESSGYPGGASEFYEGKWSATGSAGMLFNTPDDEAMAFTTGVEHFVSEDLSIGPLAQFAFTDDLTQLGVSAQVKRWITLPDTGGRGKANLQAGLGFINSDIGPSDTSWLIPVGIGYDYALDSGVSLNGAMLVNFSGLDIGDAEVMPGLTLGLRF